MGRQGTTWRRGVNAAALHGRNPAAGGVASRISRRSSAWTGGRSPLADLRQPDRGRGGAGRGRPRGRACASRSRPAPSARRRRRWWARMPLAATQDEVAGRSRDLPAGSTASGDDPGDWPGLGALAPAPVATGAARRNPAAVRALLAAIEAREMSATRRNRSDQRAPRQRRDHAGRGADVRHHVPPARARRDSRLHRRRRGDRAARAGPGRRSRSS